MNTSITGLLPANFCPASRVWIYQGHRPFTPTEATQIIALLQSFVQSWKSHGTPVKGFGSLFLDQFIILMADETTSDVSGCSTDSSVQLIRQVEQQTGVRLFDRLNLAFFIDEAVQLIPMAQLPAALDSGSVNPETTFFNNTIQTKQELETKWMIPMKNSWLASRFLQASSAGRK
jgi:hypothetical protein